MSVNINTSQPVVVLYAPPGGILVGQAESLSCQEFRVVESSVASGLELSTLEHQRNLSAMVLDATAPDAHSQANLVKCLDHMDPAFRDAGGPVIALVKDAENCNEAKLRALGVNKIIECRLEQKALRLLISIEVEEFARIRHLRRELQKRTSAIGQIVQGRFRFKTRQEAQNLAAMLSMTCPNPMPIAIGLTELFINGVEHGCLGIGHDEKGNLIEEGALSFEIEHRRTLPKFSDRCVTVDFVREPNRICFEIRDDGDGFDYEVYLSDNPKAHCKKHGRGILMAKECFEELTYIGDGSYVRAVHYFGNDESL